MADRLRRFGRIAGVAFAVCLAFFGRALAADAIRLGFSAGFSGPTRAMAVELYRGAMACFAMQNEAGGIGGHPIALLAADDGYDPGPAIENSVRFLARDKVLALFSDLGTPTVSRVLPVLRAYEDQGARLFFPVTGLAAARTPPYVRFAYNLRASYRQEIEALIDFFTRLGRQRVAIFHQADAFGRSGWDGAGRALARRGLSLCGEATFARSAGLAEDMTPQAAILMAREPQAILVVGAAPACAALIRDLRRKGIDIPVAAVSFTGGEILLRQLAAEGDRLGLDLTQDLVLSQVVPSWRDETLAAAREYREALARLGRRFPPPGGWDDAVAEGSIVGFEGFLNAKLMTRILAAMPDPLDRAGLDAAASALGSVDLGIGRPVRLDGPDHQGLDAVYLTTVRQGRLVPLSTATNQEN